MKPINRTQALEIAEDEFSENEDGDCYIVHKGYFQDYINDLYDSFECPLEEKEYEKGSATTLDGMVEEFKFNGHNQAYKTVDEYFLTLKK